MSETDIVEYAQGIGEAIDAVGSIVAVCVVVAVVALLDYLWWHRHG